MPRSRPHQLALLAALAAGCSEPDRTPPELIGQSPRPGEDNIWVFAPITLTFSEPLAAASVVGSAFELRAEDEPSPLPLEVRLAPDRRSVRLRVEKGPRRPGGLVLSVGTGLRDDAGNPFGGASWSWSVPLWQEADAPPAPAGASGVRRGAEATLHREQPDAPEELLVAWQVAAAGSGRVEVARLGQAGWQALGEPLEQQGPVDLASGPQLASTALGPVLAWLEGDQLQARRWNGSRWLPLGAGLPAPTTSAGPPVLAGDEAGRLLLAFIEDNRRVQVLQLAGDTFSPAAPAYAPGTTVAIHDLAIQNGRPVLAVVTADDSSPASWGDLRVLAWDGAAGSWIPLGGPLDRVLADSVDRPALAVGPAGQLAVAWQEHDRLSDHVYVARFEKDTWTLLGPALDLDIDAQASAPALRLDRNGDPIVAWREQAPGEPAWVALARWSGGRWTVTGAFPTAGDFSLVLEGRGEPTLVHEGRASEPLRIRRFNGATELPPGLPARAGASPCRLPEENDTSFPRTLGATGCFTDVSRRTPAPGLVPYDVISELWSDGAAKRRFLVLPAGKSFMYKEHDSWDTPPGTLFIKEFLVERGPAVLVPVETRFLVKRCEEGDCENPWQGYSYRWNDAGTDAELLTNSSEVLFKDWPTSSGTHRHTYPSQTQCGQCHLLASGGTLGIQTSQLNRPFNYGGVVDNQLRALERIGAVQRPGPGPGDLLAAAPRVPAPHDVSHPLESRVRAYFQGNCANCHRPGGSWPLMDFRYHVPLGSSRLCDLIKPGDAAGSRLYHKSQTRDTEQLPDGTTGRPMPPIGSLLVDEHQLTLLKSWIDGLRSCP